MKYRDTIYDIPIYTIQFCDFLTLKMNYPSVLFVNKWKNMSLLVHIAISIFEKSYLGQKASDIYGFGRYPTQ